MHTFRARALQDFAYALVKAEMDTDFEEDCKEIVARREKATEKLKKIDKEHPELAPVSPSKMQACKVYSNLGIKFSQIITHAHGDSCFCIFRT